MGQGASKHAKPGWRREAGDGDAATEVKVILGQRVY